MCGIAGVYQLSRRPLADVDLKLEVMNQLLEHRGPDGSGTWRHPDGFLGLAHRRLSIIDLAGGAQPMRDLFGRVITYNGEIYNYVELKEELSEYPFKTSSDTEVILAAYHRWGADCVNHLRGMFAFAIWDEKRQELFCARDKFGIKPFYYTIVDNKFYFASEAKALLPFLPAIETDLKALKEYLVFQFCMGEKTLFKGISSLQPAHTLTVSRQGALSRRYWEVYYHLDFDHSTQYFCEKLEHLLKESMRLHVRSDVPIGAYVSGGVDSGIVAGLASSMHGGEFVGFNGRFGEGEAFDESRYAKEMAKQAGFSLHELQITSADFLRHIEKVIYHLDYPVAGPGSFPQYMISHLASQHRKVVLGGQGGDEIFGGYTRYLIAYFEQCIKAAIDGTMNNGNFVVTYESIIPNLVALKNYKPLLQQFWQEGVFDSLDRRYYRLINRAPSLEEEIVWDVLGQEDPFDQFCQVFHGDNVGKESYFDSMTHFDFKTLLPALLQVEDRMSMAHGVESRVPFLDSEVVEFAATIPADVKFKGGELKRVLVHAMKETLPAAIVNRKDKMGFPVPLSQWLQGDLRDFVVDIFSSQAAKGRSYFHADAILNAVRKETAFGRKIWGLLSLELWHRNFHDRASEYRAMLEKKPLLEVR